MTDELTKGNAIKTDVDDPMLQSALHDFSASVHSWSDAAWHRTRPAVSPAPQHVAMRRSVVWVLSLVLSFGIVGTAGYERHHRQVMAQQQQQRDLQHQRELAEQHARETEELLANVDTDISREVPAAMEPLAALMSDDTQ